MERLRHTLFTPDGLLASVVDSRGTSTFAYDNQTRRLLRITEPDGRYLRYEYDADGRLTLMAYATDPGGPETATLYRYDGLDRLVAVEDSNGVTAYSYDAHGRLVSRDLSNGGRTALSYDIAGNLTSMTHVGPSGQVLERFTYAYDTVGNRVSETTLDGTRHEYAYDN